MAAAQRCILVESTLANLRTACASWPAYRLHNTCVRIGDPIGKFRREITKCPGYVNVKVKSVATSCAAVEAALSINHS
jgi:putative hydrolase of the HAD superfamily